MKRFRQTTLFQKQPAVLQNKQEQSESDCDADKTYLPHTDTAESSDSATEVVNVDEPSTSKKSCSKRKRRRTESVNAISTTINNIDKTPLSTVSCKSSGQLLPKYSDYFQIQNQDGLKTGLCKVCEKSKKKSIIKMTKSNTSGLKWHLSKSHPTEYLSMFPVLSTSTKKIGNGQTTLLEMYKKPNQQVIDKEELDTKLVECLAIKYLPFNFFDDQITQDLFSYLNKQADVPKRTAMRSKVLERFSFAQAAVLKILKENTSKISFTIDGWTSINNKSYYGITAHFIDDLWKLHSLVLDFIPADGKHTGEDIAKLFYCCLDQYKLVSKVQGITVDNAAANTTFLISLEKIMNEKASGNEEIAFNAEEQHFRCFAHIINLGVQDILKLLRVHDDDDTNMFMYEYDGDSFNDTDGEIDESSPPLLKLRRLFIKIKKSEQWQKKLQSCCEAVNIKYLTTSVDVSTRWNSTHDMITLGQKMKPAINALCVNNEVLRPFQINETDWYILMSVHKYLKHFKSLSKILGGGTYVTLPLVVIGLNMLLDKIESLIFELDTKKERNQIDETILLAFQSGRDKLLKHYKKNNWTYCTALILDPRHKVETFSLTAWGSEMKETSYQKFENAYRKHYAPEKPNAAKLNSSLDLDVHDDLDLNSLFADYSVQQQSSEYWRHELTEYLEARRANKDENILDWWQRHQPNFPNLSRMARDILCIPATSVPAERLFSKAGLTIRKHRNRLNSESARSLLCLNSWFTCTLAGVIKDSLKNKEV